MMNMNDHSTGDKLALQKRGEQTTAGVAKYSDTIRTGLAWANATLPVGTYNDLAKEVYAILLSKDPNRYEQAARALSGMMDESARQQKAFHDATEGSKVVLGGDPEKAAEYVRQLRAANVAKAQAGAEKKAKAEAVAKANADAKAAGGTQGSNNGSGGAQAGGTGTDTGGTYASADVPKGGTKTIGYDPNPGNVSLAYAMRNAPEQERRAALIAKWNQENGSTGYATGEGMLTSGSNGTYATGEGMQSPMPVSDNWKFREAWKDPMAIIGHFGRGAFTDNEYNQLVNHAVNDLGYNKDIFSGSRYV